MGSHIVEGEFPRTRRRRPRADVAVLHDCIAVLGKKVCELLDREALASKVRPLQTPGST
jgi:hypothetical protein